MATIEERARQYATKIAGGIIHEGDLWQASYDKYIEIATEQRKIDTQKVYHALENVLSKEILESLRNLMEEKA